MPGFEGQSQDSEAGTESQLIGPCTCGLQKMGTQVKDLMTPRGSNALIRDSANGVEESGGSRNSVLAMLSRTSSGPRKSETGSSFTKKRDASVTSVQAASSGSLESRSSWTLSSAQPLEAAAVKKEAAIEEPKPVAAPIQAPEPAAAGALGTRVSYCWKNILTASLTAAHC